MCLQEMAARLLFMMVRWVQTLTPFRTLTRQDQINLVEETWKDLFLLHLTQWAVSMDLPAILAGPKPQAVLSHDDAAPKDLHYLQVLELQCKPN